MKNRLIFLIIFKLVCIHLGVAQVGEPDTVSYAEMAPFVYLNGPNGGSQMNMVQTYFFPYGSLVNYTASKTHIHVNYRDGFGEQVMRIDLRQTPNLKHLISVQRRPYASEHISTSYLPYASKGVDSYIQPEVYEQFEVDQAAYYANPPANITANPYAVSQTKVGVNWMEQGDIGAEWQLPNVAIPNSGHTAKTTQTFIKDTHPDFVRWKLTSTGIAPDGDMGSYVDDRIVKTVYKSPDWISGKTGTKETYTDQYGRLRLERRYLDESNYAQTAYIYDQYDRLAVVVPPGTPYQTINEGDGVFEKHLYIYRYNTEGQLSASKTPQKDWSYIVYDKLDRPVLTQDALQREKGIWAFIKYDKLGRTVVSGVYATSQTPQQLQTAVNTASYFFEERDGLAATGYTNRTFPGSGLTEYQVFYYDSYEYIPVANPWRTTAEEHNKYVSGLPVSAKTRILGSNDFLWQTQFYDKDYRPNVQYSQNNLGGYDKSISRYDYAGLQTSAEVQHYTTAENIVIRTRNAYDHRGRLLMEYMQVGSQPEVLYAELEYNELGQVIARKQHSTDGGSTFLQTQQFSYDKVGQLKSVNNVNNTGNAQLFAYEVQREDAPYPSYAGNVGAVKSKIHATIPSGSRVPDYLSYRYDGLDRLKSVATSSAGVGTGDYDEFLNYDVRGNITALGRYAEISGTRTRVDSLQYTYDHDRHIRIDNVAGVSGTGFSELSQANNEYRYNGAGFLYADDNKGISHISYNAFGLMDTVSWSNGNRLVYRYTGGGRRLSKTFISGGNSLSSYYVNGVQYSSYNGGAISLDFAQIPDGRLRKVGGSFRPEYDLTDHLGNTRVTFDEDPLNPGQARLLQHNSYYAFGGAMPGPAMGFVSGEKNKYLYNGKELQEETGLYDYGFRMYDPAIGRWHAVDPLAENHYDLSGYNYVMNNPLRYIDPMGLDTVDITDKSGKVSAGDWIKIGNEYQQITQKMIEDIRAGRLSSTFHLIPEVVINRIRGGGSGNDTYTGAGKYYHSYLEETLRLLGANSGSNWEAKEALRREQEARDRALVAADEKAALAAREKARVLVQKASLAQKGWDSFGTVMNAYAGFNQINLAIPLMGAPTGISQLAGGYLLFDGASRLATSSITLLGIWTDDASLKNIPHNGLGLLGAGINPDASKKMQLMGDFGLSRSNLINFSSKSQSWMNSIQSGWNIVRPYKDAITDYYDK